MKYYRVIAFSLVLYATIGIAIGQVAPTLVGYIAYVGEDHNVYVTNSTASAAALTTDAESSRRYQFPTWSTDGRLAFFCCDTTFSQRFGLEIYVASPDLTAAKLLYETENEGYTYSYWSPANCAAGPTCRDLAVLVTQPGQPFKVELIRQNGIDTMSRTAATGSPFYFSWNQDGQRMLWHRNNRLVSLFSVDSETGISDLLVTPSGFQAPAWSPVDDRAAIVQLESSGTTGALVTVDGDERIVLVSGIPASIRGFSNVTALNWSPDGRFIAYRVINRFGASPLFVVDSLSGVVVTSTTDTNVLAFFWSPDSNKLAYLTPSAAAGNASASLARIAFQPDQEALFTWSILDVASGTARTLAGFTPTASMTYLLAYFDQFSQSHQIWSPDSRYLVYGETVDGGSAAVSVLDTSAMGSVPFKIADGEIGIWSYH